MLAALGACRYVNAPGGRALYDPGTFGERGVELRFLTPYTGSQLSVLRALVEQPPRRIRHELLNACRLDDDVPVALGKCP